jgi:murein DD-endopeptidase MepM/ murein hydrolase activator NlpD
MIVPHADSPPETLRVPGVVVQAAGLLLVLALLGGGFLVYRYVAVHALVLQMQRNGPEAPAVSVARVREITGDLARLEELDRRLRMAAGLAPFQATRIGRGGGRLDAEASAAPDEPAVRLLARLPVDVQGLEQEITSRAQGLRELTRFVEAKKDVLASTPAIWPVDGMITDAFGRRRSPFSGRSETHEGLDVAAPLGTTVRAAADGVTSFAGPLASYGTVVFLRHRHGFATLYAHLGRVMVKTGQPVVRGAAIGSVGLTGRTTGPHLHYEVHVRGTPVNPLLYIVDAADARRALAALPGGRGGGSSGGRVHPSCGFSC